MSSSRPHDGVDLWAGRNQGGGPSLSATGPALHLRVPPRQATPCRVAVLPGAGTQSRSQVEALLANRLRIVTLIVLGPTVVFLVRALLEPRRAAAAGPLGVSLQAAVALVTAALAALLWGRRRLPLWDLRAIELTVFGMLAAFFAWLQYRAFSHLPHWTASDDARPSVLILLTSANATRWFFL